MPKPLKILWGVVGAVLLAFGFKVILAEKMQAEGGLWRGAGWELNGESAIAMGATLAALGVYVIFLVLKNK
ncbi:MAG: hypothetical protein M0Q95_14805 [Porticoccaceae bacterium]|nr:hypothetical protein [Porticoccaceae bacterium]